VLLCVKQGRLRVIGRNLHSDPLKSVHDRGRVNDGWTSAARLGDGRVFRPVNRGDKVQGEAMSQDVVSQMLQQIDIFGKWCR
jgi:hypothetical protein